MTVMWQTLLVSKESFNFLSTSKMAAVGMDIKVKNLSLKHQTNSAIYFFKYAGR